MSDIVEHPEAYFRGLVPERDALLERLEKEAEEEDIKIVGPVVGELLFVLAVVTGAGRILEFGTATGYSAIHLARGSEGNNGRVYTVEKDAEWIHRAQKNIIEAGLEERIRILEGDADAVAAGLEGDFDLVFLDVEKEDYDPLLDHCHRLLRPGGLLFADNVAFLQAGPFNRKIHRDDRWRNVHLLSYLPGHSPENDGLCLAARL